MFLILVIGVILAVTLVVILAMPHRVRREMDATSEAFGQTADQLRPAMLRVDDAAATARARRPRRAE